MGRVLAMDYGLKRTGIAVTDPLRIIATPLETVATSDLLEFLRRYARREEIDALVIGMPKTMKGTPSEIAPAVSRFIEILRKEFPGKKIHEVDERFTSHLARRALVEGGMKKKNRRKKENIDMVSAAIMLQDFLEASSGVQH